MAPGPIPWRDIVAYADRIGLDRGETDALIEIISQMDTAWLAFHEASDGKSDKGDKTKENQYGR